MCTKQASFKAESKHETDACLSTNYKVLYVHVDQQGKIPVELSLSIKRVI